MALDVGRFFPFCVKFLVIGLLVAGGYGSWEVAIIEGLMSRSEAIILWLLCFQEKILLL